MPNLIDYRFHLLFTGPTRPPAAETRAAVLATSEEGWAEALDQLAPHKVYPLLAHRLGESSLLAEVPASARTRLTSFHAEVRVRNMLLLLTLASILRRAHADALDPMRVRRLMANEGAWVLFLRVLCILRRAGEELPPALLRPTRTVPPLTLGAALRRRRIIPWGLPAPLGWARLAAHQLGLHRADRLPPLPEDLVLWPFDALAAKVAPSLARVTRR